MLLSHIWQALKRKLERIYLTLSFKTPGEIIAKTFPTLLKGVVLMSEKSTKYSHKDLKPGLVTLMIDGQAVEQITVTDADTIDLTLEITEKKK